MNSDPPPAVTTRKEYQQELLDVGCWHSCTNCEFANSAIMDTTGEVECTICHVRPPGCVIIHGCDKWVFRVPF